MREPAGVVAVFGRVGDRIAHPGQAAFVEKVDDELELVQRLEVGGLRLVASLDQGLVGSLDEGRHPAAEDDLLAEEVGLGFFFEGRFEHPGSSPSQGSGVREPEVVGLTGGILMNGEKTRHARPLGIRAADKMPGTFGRNHEHVDIVGRNDGPVMDVEPMSEHEGIALVQLEGDLIAVEVTHVLVGDQHHDHIGPTRRFGRGHDLEAGLAGLLSRGRIGSETDDHLHPGLGKIEGMGVPLAAIPDHGHFAPLDQGRVGVALVVDLAHRFLLS